MVTFSGIFHEDNFVGGVGGWLGAFRDFRADLLIRWCPLVSGWSTTSFSGLWWLRYYQEYPLGFPVDKLLLPRNHYDSVVLGEDVAIFLGVQNTFYWVRRGRFTLGLGCLIYISSCWGDFEYGYYVTLYAKNPDIFWHLPWHTCDFSICFPLKHPSNLSDFSKVEFLEFCISTPQMLRSCSLRWIYFVKRRYFWAKSSLKTFYRWPCQLLYRGWDGWEAEPWWRRSVIVDRLLERTRDPPPWWKTSLRSAVKWLAPPHSRRRGSADEGPQ